MEIYQYCRINVYFGATEEESNSGGANATRYFEEDPPYRERSSLEQTPLKKNPCAPLCT